jgi:sialidase-1
MDQMLPMKLTLALFFAWTLRAVSAPEFFDVFRSDQEGYRSIRIPSLVTTKQGTLLAFAEGRAQPKDQAENDIVSKRSSDGGATWSPLRVLAEDGMHSLNNPTAVVTETGRVLLMYQRIPGHMHETSQETATGYDGPNIYRTFLITSDDDGVTWSPPRDVTRGTKRETRATTVCSGPGLAIQLTRGPHKGRLVVPFNEGPYHQWNNYAALSDDGGETWRCGENVPQAMLGDRSQINEVQMVELSDGSVFLNSRQFAGAKVRRTSVSRDGGATWGPIAEAAELRDPSCMASVIRYSFDDANGHGRLLYAGPDSARRDTGTIYLSTDDGATWPIKKELWPGAYAYSVLTRLADGQVGCLFEADGYQRCVFAHFPIEWVTTPAVAESTQPVGRTERSGKFGFWPQRHEEKRLESKRGGVRLAFLGDSITQGWETTGQAVWEHRYASRAAVNYGFNGDSTQHVLWRLDHGEWDGIAPDVCVLLIGANNVRHSEDSPEQIAQGIRAILARLAQRSPTTKVLLLAILPRGADAKDPYRQRAEAVNRHLSAFADGQRVHFLNAAKALLEPEGTLSPTIAPDLLHLSATGYARLAEAIEPKLGELLAEGK